jgi:GNAT superfamily N-acetyltransferase
MSPVATTWSDPLYRPVDVLPSDGARRSFGGVEAVVYVIDTEPDTVEAMWMADRSVRLQLIDSVGAEQLAAMLPDFLEHAASIADRPTSASVTLPSRDVDRGRVAREAGMQPMAVLALTSPPVVVGSGSHGVEIRDAAADDAEALAALWWEQAHYEGRIGALRATPAIQAAIGRAVPGVISGGGTTLVAVRDSTVVGTVFAETPEHSTWASSRVRAASTSYLSMASTTESARGSGVATALVDELHRRHRAAGVEASALHYSAFNPLSVPFWSQRGYRPFLTSFAMPLAGSAPCPEP